MPCMVGTCNISVDVPVRRNSSQDIQVLSQAWFYVQGHRGKESVSSGDLQLQAQLRR